MDEELAVPYPQYHCGQCGRELPLTDARLTVTCDSHGPEHKHVSVEVRHAAAEDRHLIEDICDQALGETEVDAFGNTFDVFQQENLIAIADGEFAGMISLAGYRGDLAIVLLTVYPAKQGLGIGSALVQAACERAVARSLPGLTVAVSNDDVPLFSFYQRLGFTISSIETGLLADRYGSAEPGFSGIPVRDEIRLRRGVDSRC